MEWIFGPADKDFIVIEDYAFKELFMEYQANTLWQLDTKFHNDEEVTKSLDFFIDM
jgi:hypothetical protein